MSDDDKKPPAKPKEAEPARPDKTKHKPRMDTALNTQQPPKKPEPEE